MKFPARFLTVIVLVLLIPAVLMTAGCFLPPCYGDTYYAELPQMLDRIKQSEGRRLILLGNSDIAFGIDGNLLESILAEKGYPYTVCPFGLYGAVGTDAMLSLSEKELRKDDIVLFVVEPVSESLSEYMGATALWKCAESAPFILLSLQAHRYPLLLANYLPYLQSRFAYWRTGTSPQVQGVYARNSFDDRCDLIYDRPGNQMLSGYDAAQKIRFSDVSISDGFAAHFSAYCSHAQTAGARVMISFSPVNRSAIQDPEPESVLRFFNHVLYTFPCPVISDPNRYILDSGWFYDSNFHLNSAGADLRTLLLAQDILSELGCTSPIENDFPSMPAPIQEVSSSGGDEGAFTYTALDEAYCISGLTSVGKAMSSLTIPSLHEGKPVISINETALENATALEAITIPSGIAALPDNLFLNCPSLQKIVLLHTGRPCNVSPHSLDGTSPSLQIFVPAGAFSMYREGYGCAQNDWEPYLDILKPY